MPHSNAAKQLQTYGQVAIDLDALTDRITAVKAKHKSGAAKAVYCELLDFSTTHDLRPLIAKLAQDKYAYNREIAAVTIFYWWEAWKFTIPYSTAQDKADYKSAKLAYSKRFAWTFPIVHRLLHDTCVGPIVQAVYAVRELSEIAEQNGDEFRNECIALCGHPSTHIRLSVVSMLTDIFPSNDEARHMLSSAALDCLIKATYDPVEKVRDWACFVLWLGVGNTSQKVEKALIDAMNREDPYSDVYMEAVIGLAGYGNEKALRITCAQFMDDNVGNGWCDAVEQSDAGDCLLALIAAYEKFLQVNPHDSRLPFMESVIEDWNDV